MIHRLVLTGHGAIGHVGPVSLLDPKSTEILKRLGRFLAPNVEIHVDACNFVSSKESCAHAVLTELAEALSLRTGTIVAYFVEAEMHFGHLMLHPFWHYEPSIARHSVIRYQTLIAAGTMVAAIGFWRDSEVVKLLTGFTVLSQVQFWLGLGKRLENLTKVSYQISRNILQSGWTIRKVDRRTVNKTFYAASSCDHRLGGD